MFKTSKKKKAKQQKANKTKQQIIAKSYRPIEEEKKQKVKSEQNEKEKEEVIVTQTQIIRSAPGTPKEVKKKISIGKEEEKQEMLTSSTEEMHEPLSIPTNLIKEATIKILNDVTYEKHEATYEKHEATYEKHEATYEKHEATYERQEKLYEEDSDEKQKETETILSEIVADENKQKNREKEEKEDKENKTISNELSATKKDNEKEKILASNDEMPSEPKTSDPEAFELTESEPEVLVPAASESTVYGLKASDHIAFVLIASEQPEASETESSEPEASEPEAPKPEAFEPEAPKPEASKPEAPKPEASKPEAPKPEASEPEAPKPEASEPEAPKPEASEFEAPKPEASEPEAPKPATSRPEAPDPSATESTVSGPGASETEEKAIDEEPLSTIVDEEKEANEEENSDEEKGSEAEATVPVAVKPKEIIKNLNKTDDDNVQITTSTSSQPSLKCIEENEEQLIEEIELQSIEENEEKEVLEKSKEGMQIDKNDDRNEVEAKGQVALETFTQHLPKPIEEEKKRTIEELEEEILNDTERKEQLTTSGLFLTNSEAKTIIEENQPTFKNYEENDEEIKDNDLPQYDEHQIMGADEFEMAYLSVSHHLARMRNLMEFKELEKQRKEQELKIKDEEDKALRNQQIEDRRGSGEYWEVQHYTEEENGVGKIETMRKEQIFICDRPRIGSVIVKTDENRLVQNAENSTIKVFVLHDIDALRVDETEEKINPLPNEKEKETNEQVANSLFSFKMNTEYNKLVESGNNSSDDIGKINDEVYTAKEEKESASIDGDVSKKNEMIGKEELTDSTEDNKEDREHVEEEGEIKYEEEFDEADVNKNEINLDKSEEETDEELQINEDFSGTSNADETVLNKTEECSAKEENNLNKPDHIINEEENKEEDKDSSFNKKEKEITQNSESTTNQIDDVETLNRNFEILIKNFEALNENDIAEEEDNSAHKNNENSRTVEAIITGTNVEMLNENVNYINASHHHLNETVNNIHGNCNEEEENDESNLEEERIKEYLDSNEEHSDEREDGVNNNSSLDDSNEEELTGDVTILDENSQNSENSDSGINDSQDEYERHIKETYSEKLSSNASSEDNLNEKEDFVDENEEGIKENTALVSSGKSSSLNRSGLIRNNRAGLLGGCKSSSIKSNQRNGKKDKVTGSGNKGHRLNGCQRRSNKNGERLNKGKPDLSGCEHNSNKNTKGMNFHKNCFVENNKGLVNKKKIAKNQSRGTTATKNKSSLKVTEMKMVNKSREVEEESIGMDISEISDIANKNGQKPAKEYVEFKEDNEEQCQGGFFRQESYTEIERSYLSTIDEENKELDDEDYNFIKNEEYFERRENGSDQNKTRNDQNRKTENTAVKSKQNMVQNELEDSHFFSFENLEGITKALKFLQSKNITLSFENIATYLKTVFGLNKQQCIEYIEMAKNSGMIRNIMNNNDTTITNRKVESFSKAIQTDDNTIDNCKLVTINTATQTDPIEVGDMNMDKNSDSNDMNEQNGGGENSTPIAADCFDHILSQIEQLNSTIKATATADILGDPHDPRNALYKHMNSQISHQQLVINQLVSNLTSTTKFNTLQLQSEQARRRIKSNDDYETLSPSSAVLLSSCDNRKSSPASRYGISRQQQFSQPSCYDNSTNNNNTMFVIGNNTLRGDINSIQSNFNGCTPHSFLDLAEPVLVNQRNAVLVKSRQIKRSQSVRFHRRMDDSTETTLV